VPGIRKDDPTALVLHGVVTQPAEYKGRRGTRIELTASPGADSRGFREAPSTGLALLPNHMRDGVFAVDLAGEANGRGDASAAPTVGLVFDASADASTYSAVMLRLADSQSTQRSASSPRLGAIQYFSHPSGRGGGARAVVADAGRWIRLRVEISGPSLRAFLDEQPDPVLTVNALERGRVAGRLGFLVGGGTTGYFGGVRLLQ
jgi:hypothetical protein